MQIIFTHFVVQIAISILALAGFSIASYIYNKKRQQKRMICPMRGANCETVIHSTHSKILSIPVEILGMLYYAVITLSYSFIVLSGGMSDMCGYLLFGMSACAVIFSLYLVLVQALVIKHWCTWCLFSAFISLSIFGLSYFELVQ